MRRRVCFFVAAMLLAAHTVVSPPVDAAAHKGEPNLAYAIIVNIPDYDDDQGLQEFACMLCETPTGGKPAADYLATIDVDEKSATYGEIIATTPMPNVAPELHHMAIDEDAQRAVLFDLYRNEANVVDIGTDPRQPELLKVVDLAEESRNVLGPVEGLVVDGEEVSVGYAMPHGAYRLPTGNFLIAMVSAYVPEVPELHLGAPGGFIELTPDGDVVSAFPKLVYEDGVLSNDGMFTGAGVFSIDYDERLGMMAHADLMTARTFLCAGLLLDPGSAEPGSEVVLWDVDPADPSAATVFQRIQLPAPFITAPAFVPHPVNGLDVVFVSTFSSGVWALTRPTGSGQQFELSHVYPLEQPHGVVHLRLHPTKDVLYLSDPYGDQVHVLDFRRDALAPRLLQTVALDEVHMMKFSDDGKTFYASNGLASILGFALNESPFSPQYGMTAMKVHGDGRLAPSGLVFDGERQGGEHRVFIGDFFLRRNPHPFV